MLSITQLVFKSNYLSLTPQYREIAGAWFQIVEEETTPFTITNHKVSLLALSIVIFGGVD